MFAPRRLVLTLTALALATAAHAQPKPGGDKKDPPPKLPTEQQIMAVKLKHSEALVRAVTLEDYKQIEAHATALERISRAAEFLNARRTEEYQFQAVVFQRAARTMAARAKERNSDGVMLAYLDLSKSCLMCHQTFRAPKGD